MSRNRIQVGLVGAGYIAPWHAAAVRRCRDAELVGVCDQAAARAEALATRLGVKAFDSLDAMVEATGCRAVHALVPPAAHRAVVEAAAERGLHVMVEKPMAGDADDGEAMADAAERKGVRLAVNHNFLFLPSSEALAEAIASRKLGPLRELRVRWAMPLPQVKAGPHDRWPFDAPHQPLVEVGPHPLAFVRHLLPGFELAHAEAEDRVELPHGRWCYRRWSVAGHCNSARVEVLVDLAASLPKLDVTARGLAGEARLDYARDLFTLERPSAAGIVFEPWVAGRRVVRQLNRGLRTNLLRQAKSLDKLSPFGLSLARSVAAFHHALARNAAVDPRHDPPLALGVMRDLRAAIDRSDPGVTFAKVDASSQVQHEYADVLVTGGAGFIGRALVANLVGRGWKVRVLSRGGAAALAEQHGDAVEIVRGDLTREDDIKRALHGAKRVAHLAKPAVETWPDYLARDVEPTARLGELAADAGVERFVYTGTIDSYDAGASADPITDDTPLDPKIDRRNLYAQAKALGETKLRALEASRELPLVIVRPGIVIGEGGPPAHWGVAMWASPTTCRYWGAGGHPLPFVLVEDVAEGLRLALEHDAAVSRSFLLVGPPLMSARQYVQAYGEAIRTEVDAEPRAIWRYFAEDFAKYLVKRAVGRRDRRPSYHDWRSRTQRRGFDARFAADELGWEPCRDFETLARRGVEQPAQEMIA